MVGMTKLDVNESLAGIVSAMKADSYGLEIVEVADVSLHLRIDALNGACEDCLAPHEIMAGLISSALGGRYTPQQIQIVYPMHITSH